MVVAIWGMETNYGTNTGGFGVIEALATLAWDGRRSAYFRSELLAALRVLDGGHIPPERMRGSWAGAMGQPQFMPSNFERLAVDFDGDGRRDIWDSRADALASIANYLSRHGWREGEPWGLEVLPPGPVETYDTDAKRPIRDWARLGFRRVDGGALPGGEVEMGLVQPNRSAGKVFLGGHNLRVDPPLQPAGQLRSGGGAALGPGGLTRRRAAVAAVLAAAFLASCAPASSLSDARFVVGDPYGWAAIWSYPREDYALSEVGPGGGSAGRATRAAHGQWRGPRSGGADRGAPHPATAGRRGRLEPGNGARAAGARERSRPGRSRAASSACRDALPNCWACGRASRPGYGSRSTRR